MLRAHRWTNVRHPVLRRAIRDTILSLHVWEIAPIALCIKCGMHPKSGMLGPCRAHFEFVGPSTRFYTFIGFAHILFNIL